MSADKSEPFGSSRRFSTSDDSHPSAVDVVDLNNGSQLDIAVVNSKTK